MLVQLAFHVAAIATAAQLQKAECYGVPYVVDGARMRRSGRELGLGRESRKWFSEITVRSRIMDLHP